MIVFMLTFLIFLSTQPLAQVYGPYDESVERMFYSEYYIPVKEGIRELTKKHAIYTYVLANLATPEIDLIALLPVEDRQEIQSILPDNEDHSRVIIEFVMSKMTYNSKKLSVLTGIWGNKAKSLKNIVSLGKQ